MSIVRENLMTRQGYSPYCGGEKCQTMPRTSWNGRQFRCHRCGWESAFPADFIAEYRAKWNLDKAQPIEPTKVCHSPLNRCFECQSGDCPCLPL